MNKQKFIEFLRKPAGLDEKNILDLEKLTEEYPYFQSARTLLAKVSKINKTKSAKKHIGSAAIYATDRILLKRYLNDELIFLSPMSVHESHEADYERDIQEEIKTVKSTSIQSKLKNNPHVRLKSKAVAPPPSPPKEAPKKEVDPPAKAVEKPKPTPVAPPRPPKKVTDEDLVDLRHTSSSSLDSLINELYKDMKELRANREKFMERERQLEEEEAVDEALKKATTKSQPKEDIPESDEKKGEPTVTADTKKTEEEEAPVKKDNEPPKKPSESRSARGNRTGEKSTSSDISSASTTPKKAAAKKTSTAKKTARSTGKSSPKKADSNSNVASKKTDEGKDDKGEPRKAEQNDIISSFIKSNPSISPVDSKRKNDIDLSNESTEFHPEIASEYLAEIYLEQGKKDRAIQIYEALVVKFPEKSVYFADIIKKLKE